MIKTIIFDFDGIILESIDVKTEAFKKLYQPFGSSISNKVVENHLANGGISRYEKIKIYHKQLPYCFNIYCTKDKYNISLQIKIMQ